MGAQHPDEFPLHVLDLSPPTFLKVLEEEASALREPAVTLEEVLAKLDQIGLGGLVAEIRRHAR